MLVDRWRMRRGGNRLYTIAQVRDIGRTRLDERGWVLLVIPHIGRGNSFSMDLVLADRDGGSRGKVTPRGFADFYLQARG